MVELSFRAPKRSKPAEQPKSKNKSPYYFPLAFLALLALIPLLGVLGTPSGPTLVLSGQSEVSAVVPSVLPAQSFSCRSSSAIADDSRFAFDTNSKLDSFSIDRQSKVITVGVSGPEGSEGIFCINVPKDFIPTRELRTSIDNISWNPRIEEFSDSNIVSLAYHHSERVIRIFGEPSKEIPQNVPTNGTQISGAGQQQQQQQVVVIVPGTQGNVIVTPQQPKPDGKKIDVCPPTKLTPGSIIASGMPVVFTSGEKPTFTTAPDASGIRVQTKTRAIVNFISDVGETVGVTFKLDNLSSEDSLVRVRVSASDTLLVDLVKSGSIDVVKPIKSNEYLVKLAGGAVGAELVTKITSLTAGFHPFLLEILPLFEESVCR